MPDAEPPAESLAEIAKRFRHLHEVNVDRALIEEQARSNFWRQRFLDLSFRTGQYRDTANA